MAFDPWPPGVPFLMTQDGFSDGMADGRIASETERGPGKVRRRTSAQVRPLRGNVEMNSTELATMRSFVDTTLRNGTLPFTFTDPVDLLSIDCRFAIRGSLPKWAPKGPHIWTVMLDIEVLP